MHAPLALLPLVAMLFASSCLTRQLLPPPGAASELALEDPSAPSEPPVFVRETTDDWVQLTSGEWLRGELVALARGTLEFDSEELDELALGWENVARVHTRRTFLVLFENRATAIGRLIVQDDLVQVTDDEGSLTFRRGDVQRIVTGSLLERDRWSGDVSLGFSARRGNTDQTDTSFGASARRRTRATRLDLSLNALDSEQNDTSVAQNLRFRGNIDAFVTSRLFLTPLGLEVFHDPFQNIDLRATPYTGLGYDFVDGSQLEVSGTFGLGYRWTRFDSVAPGEDREESELVAILTSSVGYDLTEKIELDAGYSLQIGSGGFEDAQQSADLELSYDVWADLDLLLRFSWTRVGDPEPDANGVSPEPDDFYVTLGLAWSF